MERWKKRSRRGERRILTVIAVITILLVMALIAFYVWGPQILDTIGKIIPAATGTVNGEINGAAVETAPPTYTEPMSLGSLIKPAENDGVPAPNADSRTEIPHTVGREKIPFVTATPNPAEEGAAQ